MLKTLFIKNFILIKEATIEFSNKLNIITGESGSGKSAILKAIDAVLGAKADATYIFPNESYSIIEAVFEVKENLELKKILTDYEIDKTITLRREISKTNRSRFFLNDQLITITQIKECSIFLADYISQKQAASLSQDKYIRSFVDSLADCKSEINNLNKLWNQSNALSNEINMLLTNKDTIQRAIPNIKEKLALIEKVNYQTNEEKQLEEEYIKLINTQEQKGFLVDLCNQITDDPNAVLTKFKQIEKTFRILLDSNDKFNHLYENFQNIFIELKDLSFELAKANSSNEPDFNSLQFIENRIQEIDNLKKAFEGNFTNIEIRKKQFLKTLNEFEELDEKVSNLELNLQKSHHQIDELCSTISLKRNKAKAILEQKMQLELNSLNLNNATFELLLEKRLRSINGDEFPIFLFSANLNSKLQVLQKIASGGEIARVMLALKCIILNQDSHNCLIFDEIDANVGGESAAIIGDKLLMLSQHKQIICVTHFIQVAKKANSHFLIEKTELNQENITLISKLNNQQKASEYQRMIGQISSIQKL
jgi:DNA repair protein RecN (Recombination protein N)